MTDLTTHFEELATVLAYTYTDPPDPGSRGGHDGITVNNLQAAGTVYGFVLKRVLGEMNRYQKRHWPYILVEGYPGAEITNLRNQLWNEWKEHVS